jgi:signal peptidase II
VGRALHRLQAKSRAEVTDDAARRPDVRVGSATDALTPVSAAERRVGAGAREWLGFAAVAGAAVAADQATKRLVSSALELGESVEVAGPLDIHHVQNSGIAFGLFQSATSIVIVLTGLVVAWLVLVFARSGSGHPLLPVGLGLVVGGSVSNLLDRIRLGHVTDFLDFGFWPAFNLADSFIVAGVAILLGLLVSADYPRRRPV